jgi:hypothetical protein
LLALTLPLWGLMMFIDGLSGVQWSGLWSGRAGRDKGGGVRRLIISVHLSREWPENWKRKHGESMSDIKITELRLVSVIWRPDYHLFFKAKW